RSSIRARRLSREASPNPIPGVGYTLGRMKGNRHLQMTVNPDDTVTVTNKHGTELLVDCDGIRGLSPLELMLAALGSCSAVDFALLMTKQRDPVEPLRIEVDGDKDDNRM